MVVDGQILRQKAIDQWTRDLPVKAKRGDIVDCNGKILAGSKGTYSVFIRTRCVTNPAQVADVLSNILNVDYKDSIDYKIELSDTCVFDTTKVLTLINKFRTYRLIELNTNDDGNLFLDFIDHGGSLIRFKDEAEKDKVLLRSPKLIRISDLWYYSD